ncbi:vWA domain-containing protein [Laceyella putida]|uniref:VWA domain-containing protein n=1 Tax=Laceyella putida TaxID=110101 RepID=A0ABW2RQI6_9BACL
MFFLQPNLLWLAALILPVILLLYLLKRKYRDQTVSSILLWERVLEKMEASRPWQRLRQQWLLWLQLLAAMLMILGLSRPALPTEGLQAKHTILVIDVSGSMRAKEGEGTRLDQAKAKVEEWTGKLGGEQSVTLIAAGKTPRVLLSQSQDANAVKQTVRKLAAEVSPADLAGALSLAYALSAEQPGTEIIYIGDGGQGRPDNGLFPHRFVKVGKQKANVAVGAFTVQTEAGRTTAFARIDNRGERGARVIATLKNERGQLMGTRALEIKADESETVTWEGLAPSPLWRVSLQSNQDALAEDNERWAFNQKGQALPVVAVGKENLFVQKVFALSGQVEWTHADEVGEPASPETLTVINQAKASVPKQGPLLLLDPPGAGNGLNLKVRRETPVTGEVTALAAHPLTKQVDLLKVAIAGVKQMEVPAWAEVVYQVGDTPLVLAGEQQGRRVVVFTFDLQKSDLPLQPSFPILMMNVLHWLAPVSAWSGLEAEAGSTLKLPGVQAEQPIRLTSLAPAHTSLQIPYRTAIPIPEQSGLWQVQAEGANQPHLRLFVPFAQEETDIAPAEWPEAPSPTEGSREGEWEMWWWLALGGLFIMGVEWVVFTRGY